LGVKRHVINGFVVPDHMLDCGTCTIANTRSAVLADQKHVIFGKNLGLPLSMSILPYNIHCSSLEVTLPGV
jgi:hypothetical protein